MSVTIEFDYPLALVRVANPPVNALSQAVRQGLLDACKQIDADGSVESAILICDGSTFIAGADIKEFASKPLEPHLPNVVNAIEASNTPWVAAIHGTALGGGCEIALGCDYRIAVPSAKLGLPEVTLGLIPGAGGTVRLPRIIGIAAAIDMITSGKPVGAEKAATLGLVDALVPEDQLEAEARKFAQTKTKQKDTSDPTVNFDPDAFGEEEWAAAIEEVRRKARGQQSPVEAVLAIHDGCTLEKSEAMARERERFLTLKASHQSKALRHAFFAERQTAKIPALKGVAARDLNHCGVIGGGTMGAGIAAAMLLSGLGVTMVERDSESAEAGRDRVLTILQASLKRGIITPAKLENLQSQFSTTTHYSDLGSCDLVIEAVFEDLEVKKQVFSKLAEACNGTTILATNTSYLDVNAIASATPHPERVIGLHFFSPAHVMKLLEVIKTDTVSETTLATGFALAKRLRKVPVLAGVCDGFIGNRILASYRKQCDYMLEDGASPQLIDQAMREFGMAMGPFEMQDMAGLDIGWANRKRLAPTRDPEERYVKIADRLCEMGRFGQKTGAGWYHYSEGSRKGEVDPAVEAIIAEEREKAGVTPREFSIDEIQDRILAAMVSEGNAILKEGIARSAADIDVVFITGYGFPRWRGGPMFAGGVLD